MTYATRDDLNAAFGRDLVDRLAVRPEDETGAKAVARALSYSAGLIDAALSVRFTLPLPSVPPLLRDIATDLAVARLASDAVSLTDDLKDREKMARADLDKVATGRMNLGLPSAGEGDRPQPILGPGGDKLFTRKRLRGF